MPKKKDKTQLKNNPQPNPELLKTNDQPNVPQGITTEFTVTKSHHEGPIPSANELRVYEDVCKGSARDIINMATSQNTHHIESEQEVIRRHYNESKRGQVFGLIIVLSGFALSGYLGYLEHGTAAGLVGSTSLASILAVFIKGSANTPDKKEKTPKK